MEPYNQQMIMQQMNGKGQNAYDSPRFWRAYARLLSCVEDNHVQEKISDVYRDIGSKILDVTTRQSGPLRVLCLGIGIGTFEFPFLHCLRQQMREKGKSRDIQVTAIDGSGAAIGCAAKLAELIFDGTATEHFPIRNGDEFAKKIEEYWPSKPLERGEAIRVGNLHSFRCLDLDFSSDLPGLGQYFPSRWHEELIGEEGSYHLVLSMFCLHHLEWWRATLVAAACRLLSPGGLLLVPQLGGATDAFTSNPVDYENVKPGNMLDRLHKSLYPNLESQALQVDARLLQARMTLPAVTDFIAQIGGKKIGKGSGDFKTNIDASVCHDLLLTKGFSVLRTLADETADYEARCNKFYNQCEPDEKCSASHRLALRLFSTPKRSTTRREFARHFGIVAPVFNNDNISEATDTYQLREAGLISPPSAEASDDPKLTFVRDTVPAILHSGVLHPDCISLTIGPGLAQREKLSESISCPNMFCRGNKAPQDVDWNDHRRVTVEEQLEDLLVFIRLRRQDPELKGFSNANLTLRQILPVLSPIPSVFTYLFDEATKRPKPSESFFSIEVLRKRSFWEIRHTIHINHPYAKAIRTWGREREPLAQRLWDGIAKLKLERKHESLGSYRMLSKCPAVWVDEWDTLAESEFVDIFEQYQKQVRDAVKAYESTGLDEWSESINKKLNQDLRKAGHPNILSEIRPLFDKATVKAMAWLLVMRHCKSVAIYPAHYVKGNRIAADDATVVMYTKPLDGPTVEGEAAKFNAIYDAARLRRSEQAGQFDELKQWRNVLGHEVTKV